MATDRTRYYMTCRKYDGTPDHHVEIGSADDLWEAYKMGTSALSHRHALPALLSLMIRSEPERFEAMKKEANPHA